MKAWIEAARPRTLPLAVASIAMGGFLAGFQGSFNWVIFLLTVATTISLQILSNLANDYGDSQHGADHQHRMGPPRMVQIGAISAASMKRAIRIAVLLTLLWGLALLFVSMDPQAPSFYVFLVLGIVAIIAAINYTSGPRPYGYSGFGDFSVVVFFGLLGVLGSYYLQTLSFKWENILPAISCGLFATAVLNINNIRDLESDQQAGKLSIPVRIGRKAATRYHWGLLVTALGCSILFVQLDYRSPWQWLFLVIVPLLWANAKAVANKEGLELDPYLKQMALTTLLYVLTFGAGLILSNS